MCVNLNELLYAGLYVFMELAVHLASYAAEKGRTEVVEHRLNFSPRKCGLYSFNFSFCLHASTIILSPCSHGKAEREPDAYKWKISHV